MGEQIAPELVERMVKHIHAVAEKYSRVRAGDGAFNPELKELREIAALLPAPVDPDLIEARKLASEWDPQMRAIANYVAGQCDNHKIVQQALAAIKRGRELAHAQGHAA